MRSSKIFSLMVAATIASPSAAGEILPAAPTLSDSDLEAIRGGFLLPNGMDISLGIAVTTRVDGEIVLGTVFTLEDAANLAVFAGGTGPTDPAEGTAIGGTGVTITESSDAIAVPTDARLLDIASDGSGVATEWGNVSLDQADGQTMVSLDGSGLSLRQLIGESTGSIIANIADNRVIDTDVMVSIDVQNSAIPLGTMMLRMDSLLSDVGARGDF